MPERDRLIIRKNKVRNSNDRSLSVPEHTYITVKELAAEANIPVGEMDSLLVDFAAERVVIEE